MSDLSLTPKGKNCLKNRVDERHDGGTLSQNDHGADEQQEGLEQGDIDVFSGLDVAPEVFQYFG